MKFDGRPEAEVCHLKDQNLKMLMRCGIGIYFLANSNPQKIRLSLAQPEFLDCRLGRFLANGGPWIVGLLQFLRTIDLTAPTGAKLMVGDVIQ
jgi:hypothetical protein